MTERDALLWAIIDHPDEDTPRLALADWLDEHGDRADRGRATFIRAQIAIHTEAVPVCPQGGGVRESRDGVSEPALYCRCAWCRTARRERDAFRSFGSVWEREALAPISDAEIAATLRAARTRPVTPADFLAEIHSRTYPWVMFRRGFVEMLGVSANEFLDHAAELFALNPVTQIRWNTHQPGECRDGYAWDERFPEGRFLWRDGGPFTQNLQWGMSNVPTEVFRRLPDAVSLKGEKHLKLYTTHQAAVESLSRGCVAYGRRERNRVRRAGRPTASGRAA